jgi:hypothetical protein
VRHDRAGPAPLLRAASTTKKETDYLTGTPLLADYLEEGLSQLGYSLEGFEIGRS